jgi:hypothetical protein
MRGCGPARRLTLFLRGKRVSRKTRPDSLPCGFPALRRRFAGGQKLVALGQLPALFAKRPLRSGYVTGEVKSLKSFAVQ